MSDCGVVINPWASPPNYELETRMEREAMLEATDVLEQCVARDSRLSRAWTVLAWTHQLAAGRDWAPDRSAALAGWKTGVETAASLDPRDPIALEPLAEMLASQGQVDTARELLERALDLGRSHADAQALLRKHVAAVPGRPADALNVMQRAMTLNPAAPDWYFSMQA